MTDRDTFAAAALTGLLANEGEGPSLSATCVYAYRIADAMLRERERKKSYAKMTVAEQVAAGIQSLRDHAAGAVDLRETVVFADTAIATLTDEEREAVDIARTVLCCTHDEKRARHAATLRSLLERLGGER